MCKFFLWQWDTCLPVATICVLFNPSTRVLSELLTCTSMRYQFTNCSTVFTVLFFPPHIIHWTVFQLLRLFPHYLFCEVILCLYQLGSFCHSLRSIPRYVGWLIFSSVHSQGHCFWCTGLTWHTQSHLSSTTAPYCCITQKVPHGAPL